MTVYTDPATYEVSCLPRGHRDRGYLLLTVEYRGKDLWGVFNGRQCLGTDGLWEWEPQPSSREDDWLATHRFPLDEALRLAREAAPHLTVNGYTLADILERHPIAEDPS
jgi:hypothetical protein